MKLVGLILTVIGALLLIPGLRQLVAAFDLGDQHSLSKALGGLAISILILVAGLAMIRNSKGKA